MLDGDGNCIPIPVDTNTNAVTICSSGEVLTGGGGCVDQVAGTDTNAETECPDGHALLGGGSCVDVAGLVQQLGELPPSLDLCAFGFEPTSGPFVDNCDGTITDTSTGLMWEKKTDNGGIHDEDNLYTWLATGTAFDGTASTVFLDTLNTTNFAGHNDCRLPKVSRDADTGMPELETIVDLDQDLCDGGFGACIDPIFGPTAASDYWSSTTDANNPFSAWFVNFLNGAVNNFDKRFNPHVRAVRGGS